MSCLRYSDLTLSITISEFDAADCPLDCSRPCEVVCPANAILLMEGKSTVELPHSTRLPSGLKVFSCGFFFYLIIFQTHNINCFHVFQSSYGMQGGVITERCYGCGRCFPVCPYDKISEFCSLLFCWFLPLLRYYFSLILSKMHVATLNSHSLLLLYVAFEMSLIISGWINIDVVNHVRDVTATTELLKRNDVDAVEIHTNGRYAHKIVWQMPLCFVKLIHIHPVLPHLNLLAAHVCI